MSRSSKGFADFFPTAPSVLQQKRSRAAQDRKRAKSKPIGEPDVARGSSKLVERALTDGLPGGTAHVNGVNGEDVSADASSMIHEENESTHGDLLNGVGSASSTSTVSSVFSTSHRATGMAHQTGSHNATALPPLTNTASSPPGKGMSPPYSRVIHHTDMVPSVSSRSPMQPCVATTTEALTPINTPPLAGSQARSTSREIKGYKAIYDPDLDKKLSSKEKKTLKVKYKAFGEEVSIHGEFRTAEMCKHLCCTC